MSILIPASNSLTYTPANTQSRDSSDCHTGIATTIDDGIHSKTISQSASSSKPQSQSCVADPGPITQNNPNEPDIGIKDPFSEILPLEYDYERDDLGRSGRFWKVYVKETNEWDAETVDRWNKSLDVILGKLMGVESGKIIADMAISIAVFAALFSAISTAFLMESSKRLQEDPADTSAQALAIISQTLLALTNGTSISTPASMPTKQIPFVPSRTVVLINILWYMSLSVSVGASFLAMLAKDWCHDFMAGRKGELYVQARRRQKKWTMIEKWKMQELILVLPSLIHVSLLLFAIGLCIYVWQLNDMVAIPVCCVCGASVAFYILSSLAAAVLEHFPYTTIISTILRSNMLKPLYLAIRLLCVLLSICGACLLMVILFPPVCLFDLCLPSVSAFLADTMASLLDCPAKSVDYWLPDDPVPEGSALSWVIANCEEVDSVDVALQALATASMSLPLEPLEKCGTPSIIARRIGFTDFYNNIDQQKAMNYMAALSTFGTVAPPPVNTQTLAYNCRPAHQFSIHSIKRMLRLIHLDNEKRVAVMLTNGKLAANGHNFAAISFGSRAGSLALGLLKDPTFLSNWVLPAIVKILREYIQPESETEALHPASIQSLAHAGSLLSVCISPKEKFDGSNIAFYLLRPILAAPFDPEGDLYRLSSPLVVAALSHSQRNLSRQSSQPKDMVLLSESVNALYDYQFEVVPCEAVFWFGLLELSYDPEQYHCMGACEGEWPWWPAFQHEVQKSPDNNISHYAIHGVSHIYDTLLSKDAIDNEIVDNLKTLDCVFEGAGINAPPVPFYVFVLEAHCRGWIYIKGLSPQCAKMLSRYTFPRLSAGLVAYLESRDVLKDLTEAAGNKGHTMQFFAICQLWLFYTLYLDSPSVEDTIKEKLATELDKYRESEHTQEAFGETREELGRSIETLWTSARERRRVVSAFGVWAYRVVECVFQHQGVQTSDPRMQQIEMELSNISPELRGLSSFTSVTPSFMDETHVKIEVEEHEPELN
ncbi:hypothetical protein RHS04_08741 [Rhizoctonia solani]|uniref:DUF6535 domain-containing protein n=1 Tax=Rhizoctonia solani TaxID=456999 RepID=A0A8H7H3D7_9AGAM|nr:hypothetical protein RHS04_08741 [Rhizoctonia solani]